MAEIRIRPENGHVARTILDPAEQLSFLEGHGLGFEQWAISKLDAAAATASGDAQGHILQTFHDEIEALKARYGYVHADVIALTPQTPNLDALLARFDKEHYHDGDEVRFTVSGRGIFTIHSDKDDAVFDVEVQPGDLLIVPDGTWHWFDLCEDRQIQCIRLFTDTSGWTPHYKA